MPSSYRISHFLAALLVTFLAGCGSGLCARNDNCGFAAETPSDPIPLVAKSWMPPSLLETDDTADVAEPKVEADLFGNVVAVWAQSDGVRYNIWSNRYTTTGGWEGAQLLESDNTANAAKVQLAVHTTGDAFAIWQQSSNIWVSRYTYNVGWGVPVNIDSLGGLATEPDVAFFSNGDALAVWTQSNVPYSVYYSRYTAAGDSWSAPVLLEGDEAGNAGYPRIAISPTGDALVAWEQNNGIRTDIYYNYFTSGGSWSGATLLEVSAGGASEYVIPQFDKNGNALAVWSKVSSATRNIWGNYYQAGVGWLGAQLVETDDLGNAFYPQFAFDSEGKALVGWEQSNGSRSDNWSNVYSPGLGWGTPVLMESQDLGNAAGPRIRFDLYDRGYAIWPQHDGTRYNIWVNTYIDGEWGEEALIETMDLGHAVKPRITIDSSGNGMATWEHTSGGRKSAWAARLE